MEYRSQALNSGRVKQLVDRHLTADDISYPGDDHRREHRIATERKEVIMDPDATHFEDAPPDIGHLPL